MARIEKKKTSRLGTPPPVNDTFDNLTEPEVAPASQKKKDGRKLRKTGMTEQFNTRVSKNILTEIRAIAKEEGRTLGKVLELMLAAYKDSKK